MSAERRVVAMPPLVPSFMMPQWLKDAPIPIQMALLLPGLIVGNVIAIAVHAIMVNLGAGNQHLSSADGGFDAWLLWIIIGAGLFIGLAAGRLRLHRRRPGGGQRARGRRRGRGRKRHAGAVAPKRHYRDQTRPLKARGRVHVGGGGPLSHFVTAPPEGEPRVKAPSVTAMVQARLAARRRRRP